MRIIVPIKQVPETSNVRMDAATGTMLREGVESIVNPMDLYAIEAALELRARFGGEVVALSMGPASAVKALKEAVAMGCDRAVLVSGRKFAGSDTWATARALAAAVGRLAPFDLIIAGERATDGDTGQVGPGLAAALGLPVASYVARLAAAEAVAGAADPGRLVVERLVEGGYQALELDLPAVLTVVKELNFPRLPTLDGKLKARALDIPVWDADTLGLDAPTLGIQGSPTRVVKITTPKAARGGTIVRPRDEAALEAAVDQLVDFLKSRKLV
jgi:electron transfer flavoprotein beta subunit